MAWSDPAQTGENLGGRDGRCLARIRLFDALRDFLLPSGVSFRIRLRFYATKQVVGESDTLVRGQNKSVLRDCVEGAGHVGKVTLGG